MRLFEYILEIYKTRSFTKAAGKLHIAQPALSKNWNRNAVYLYLLENPAVQ